MSRRIEQLLRLVADMEKFSEEVQENTGKYETELSFEELNLVAAASAQPSELPKEER